jgi:hypothetical protein
MKNILALKVEDMPSIKKEDVIISNVVVPMKKADKKKAAKKAKKAEKKKAAKKSLNASSFEDSCDESPIEHQITKEINLLKESGAVVEEIYEKPKNRFTMKPATILSQYLKK